MHSASGKLRIETTTSRTIGGNPLSNQSAGSGNGDVTAVRLVGAGRYTVQRERSTFDSVSSANGSCQQWAVVQRFRCLTWKGTGELAKPIKTVRSPSSTRAALQAAHSSVRRYGVEDSDAAH